MKNAVIRRVARFAYPHESVRRVLRGPGSGVRFRVKPSMGMTYALGYDTHNARWLSAVVKSEMTIYDIGANFGQMALQFSKWVGPRGCVVAVEPVPANVRQLRDNISLNNRSNIAVVEAALSDSDGVASFLLDPDKARMGKLEDCEPTYNDFCRRDEKFEVATMRLDDLIAQHGRPDFVKIDVEGGARGVLAGASRMLQDSRPDIYLELHGPEEQAAARDLLLPTGYRLRGLDGTIVDDPVAHWCNPLWCSPG
jgi:FkbM family methyltransferase